MMSSRDPLMAESKSLVAWGMWLGGHPSHGAGVRVTQNQEGTYVEVFKLLQPGVGFRAPFR
jgi:hypothetical protein